MINFNCPGIVMLSQNQSIAEYYWVISCSVVDKFQQQLTCEHLATDELRLLCRRLEQIDWSVECIDWVVISMRMFTDQPEKTE